MKVNILIFTFFVFGLNAQEYFYDDRGHYHKVYVDAKERSVHNYRISNNSKAKRYKLSNYIIVEFFVELSQKELNLIEKKYTLTFISHPLNNKKIYKFKIKQNILDTTNTIMEKEHVKASYPDWIML